MKPITPRERTILDLVSQGLTTRQIALRLNLSMHTVETHRKNLLLKYQASNSVELVMKASMPKA